MEWSLLAFGEVGDGEGAASHLLPVPGRDGSCLRALLAPAVERQRAEPLHRQLLMCGSVPSTLWV